MKLKEGNKGLKNKKKIFNCLNANSKNISRNFSELFWAVGGLFSFR